MCILYVFNEKHQKIFVENKTYEKKKVIKDLGGVH